MSVEANWKFLIPVLLAVWTAGACKPEVDLGVPGGGAGFLFRVVQQGGGSPTGMVETVRERLQILGIDHGSVSEEREGLIRVLVPGVSEQEADRLLALLTRTARVDFSTVDDGKAFFAALTDKLPDDGSVLVAWDPYGDVEGSRMTTAYLAAAERAKLEAFLRDVRPPAGRKLGVLPGEFGTLAYLLEDPPSLSNPVVAQAGIEQDEPSGEWVVNITFGEQDRLAFAELTRKTLHRRLAILVDGEIRSLPVVQTVIESGRARIGPSPVTPRAGTEREARALAAGIRAWGQAGGLALVRRQVTPPGP